MQRRIVIRGTQLGGYPFVLILVALPVLLTISIWLYPRELARWLISAGVLFIADLVLEAIGRRTFVEVKGERIRWSFRQPPTRGDEPIGNLRGVTIYPTSGALLEFAGGSGRVVLGSDDFRIRDITRVVEALRGLGVRVDDSRGPMESLLNILRGKSSARR
jgi:hypothetical protein